MFWSQKETLTEVEGESWISLPDFSTTQSNKIIKTSKKNNQRKEKVDTVNYQKERRYHVPSIYEWRPSITLKIYFYNNNNNNNNNCNKELTTNSIIRPPFLPTGFDFYKRDPEREWRLHEKKKEKQYTYIIDIINLLAFRQNKNFSSFSLRRFFI